MLAGVCVLLWFCWPLLPTRADSIVEPPIGEARTGPTGLINIPNAEVIPDGGFILSTYSLLPNPYQRIGNEAFVDLGVGFLPHVEFGVAMGDPNGAEDLNANAKLQVLSETKVSPAVAIGAFNLSANIEKTFYGALSKHFFGQRVEATAGYMHGGGTGAYGGLDVGLVKHVSTMLEYDSRDVNYGLKGSLFGDRALVSVEHLKQGWTLHLGANMSLRIGENAPRPSPLPALPAQPDAKAALPIISDKLAKMGLENISTRLLADPAGELSVAYENRSYNHSEMDALANVLATEAVYAPVAATRIGATALREGVPILRVSCPLAEYRDFMAGKLNAKQFGRHFLARYTASVRGARTAVDSTRVRSASYGRTDLTLTPAFNEQVGTESGLFTVAASVVPTTDTKIAPGLDTSVSSNIPVGGDLRVNSRIGYPPQAVQASHATLDHALLDWTWHPLDKVLARTYGGDFADSRRGVYSEVLLFPNDTRWTLRGSAGLIKAWDQPYDPQKRLMQGDVYYYYPPLDVTAHALAGYFLNNDGGYGIDLTRRFDQTDVGLGYRKTSIAGTYLMEVRLPIGPSHWDQEPSLFRVMPGPYIQQTYRTLSTAPNYLYLASETGNELDLGTPANDSLLNDGKMNPSYVKRSLMELRRVRAFQIVPSSEQAAAIAQAAASTQAVPASQ